MPGRCKYPLESARKFLSTGAGVLRMHASPTSLVQCGPIPIILSYEHLFEFEEQHALPSRRPGIVNPNAEGGYVCL